MRNVYFPRQYGFTIIELMTALTVGLLLTAGAAQIYLSSKQTFRFGDNLSRLSEEGQFALDLMARDIRLAGFRNVTNIRNLPAPLPNAITGVEGLGLDGSDTITNSYDSNTDCVNNPVAVTTFNAYSLQLGLNGRKALFCNMTELIANVDDLQFTYGIDVNNDLSPDRYVNADAIVNLQNIVSVRIGLLVSSAEDMVSLSQDTKNYDVSGTSIGPLNDYRARRVYSATVKIRNCLRNLC